MKNFEKISSKTIAIVGLGGVGGTALEALARTGFNNFILIDFDAVNITNLNRQILYTQNDVGKEKVYCAENRIKAINSNCIMSCYNSKIDESFDFAILDNADFIVDAIDDVKAKILICKYALNNNKPLLMSLGMANRIDPSKVYVTRLDKTTNDPLARKIRHEIRQCGLNSKDINVVFSIEEPRHFNRNLNSMIMVPSSGGLNICNYVVNYFIVK